MHPIRHIRTQVLKETQRGLGSILGVTQPTVSRWERGTLAPSYRDLERLRAEALRRNVPWNDSWLFGAAAE